VGLVYNPRGLLGVTTATPGVAGVLQSQSTPGHAQVAQKLLVNSRHKLNQERTDPVGSPRSHVLADVDRQTEE
jgi:hypothetical protein